MKKKVYTRPLAVLVSEDTYRKLLEAADRREIAISEFIREGIESKLDSLDQSTQVPLF